jgi:hypothetical protein
LSAASFCLVCCLEQVLPGLESRRPLEGPDLIVVLNGKRTAEVQDSMLVERSRFSVQLAS